MDIKKKKKQGIVHVIPQVSKMKAYIFNYKIHVHDNMLRMILYRVIHERGTSEFLFAVTNNTNGSNY
jgi:inorganic pyrophosphatase/exopolyphosphatase